MQGNEFRRWAEWGCTAYGKDPWFFLRELAQNSRDAGAQAIVVKAETNLQSEEVLIFEDDGSGLDQKEARQYLFRLYASSKEQDISAAGKYGIGFWTVLHFEPTHILIESKTRRQTWALRLDSSFQTQTLPGRLNHRGTRITLTRLQQFPNPQDFLAVVEKALIRYCSYLRQNNRQASPLPLLFNDQTITRVMELEGPISLSFRKGTVEGVVGLASQPKVVLLARGLPTWEGTSLDELSHSPPPATKVHEIARGLAPVFLLNGNSLDVTFSRQAAIENSELRKVLKVARQALARLVESHADRLLAKNIFQAARNLINRKARNLIRTVWLPLVLGLAIILPLEFFLLKNISPVPEAGQTSSPPTSTAVPFYQGATVDTAGVASQLDLSYQPALEIQFRIVTAERYDLTKGFMRDEISNQKETIPPGSGSEPSILIRLKTKAGQKLFLPKPFGFAIEPQSIRSESGQLLPLLLNSFSETIVAAASETTINYRCYPLSPLETLSPDDRSRLIRLPDGLDLPPQVAGRLPTDSEMGAEKKVELALNLVGSLMQMDISRQTAATYARAANQGNWLQRILQIGKGDCDVLNGLLTVFLRQQGIPARLVIGGLGQNGRLRPGFHAWCEYYSSGWHLADASLVSEAASSPPEAKPNREPSPSPWLWLGLLAGLILVAVFVYFAFKNKRSYRLCSLADRDQIRESLSRMGLGALLNPRAWGRDNPIWNCPLLPLLNGRALPLAQAFHLAKKKRLLGCRRDNPLAVRLSRSRKKILDLSDLVFLPLMNMLPLTTNLDTLVGLQVVQPGSVGNQPAARLLVQVNRMLKKIGCARLSCLWAPGLKEAHSLAVVVPAGIRLSGAKARRFVAVNPQSPFIAMLARLFEDNPQLAMFRLVSHLFQEQPLHRCRSQNLLRKLSRQLLNQMT